MAQIVGIHLEGPFINPEKAGIHSKEYMQPLSVDVYKQIEDDIIKIVTLAPELDKKEDFIPYLKSKGVKISAGHCVATDLSNVNQVTHLYNAMGAFSHREPSCVVSALSSNVFVEIIADSVHVCDDVLNITFKQKALEQILLISDALPLAHSEKTEHIFAGQTIYNKQGKLLNEQGVFAGSSMLLCDIVKNLADKNLLKLEDALLCASSNQLKYHNLKNNLKVHWDDLNNIEKVELI
jgi:N-acetylglucosamine-6-phosphate deacetylase